jgi:hypothetical protein
MSLTSISQPLVWRYRTTPDFSTSGEMGWPTISFLTRPGEEDLLMTTYGYATVLTRQVFGDSQVTGNSQPSVLKTGSVCDETNNVKSSLLELDEA